MDQSINGLAQCISLFVVSGFTNKLFSIDFARWKIGGLPPLPHCLYRDVLTLSGMLFSLF